MSRGLGSVERFVVGYLGVDVRRPVLLRVLAADLAHERRAARSPGRELGESCDCPGRCAVVSVALVNTVQRAVGSLARKGVVRTELDWCGRLRVSLVSWPVAWWWGQGGAAGSALCPSCGVRSAGRAVRGEAA